MSPVDMELPPTNIPRAPGPLRFLTIGAGSRGNSYAQAVTNATTAVIYAVAEPDTYRRQSFGKSYIWRNGNAPCDGQEFKDWKDWLEWETQRRKKIKDGDVGVENVSPGVDGVFICTLDEMHLEILKAIAPLNLHIMCEKPLATSLEDCLAASAALTSIPQKKVFAIGHVLRYSPHNKLLRQLLLTDRVVGDIVSLEHTEPVGWSHFAHSYVRGNWRRETAAGDGSLLTKCCHDIDIILWLLSSPPPGSALDHPYHLPKSISSMGSLTQFKKNRKPIAAGDATNCLSCPIERDCNYSAIKLYDEMHLAQGHTGWPVKIVQPDMEDLLKSSGMETARKALYKSLSEDYDSQSTPDAEIASRPWYGRCAWESDNNVCDDQFVTISWDDEDDGTGKHGAKLANLHLIAPTEKQCERRGRVYGTLGELSYDSETITYTKFSTGETEIVKIPPPSPSEPESHGGGDYGLTRAFVQAVDAVENQGWEVQRTQVEILGVTLEEAVRSHAVVFAAEEARREGKVVNWNEWWNARNTAT